MKQSFINLILLLSSSLSSCCPTCIGLPRPHERPFFERKSFLTAVQKPSPQKPQEPKKDSPHQPIKG